VIDHVVIGVSDYQRSKAFYEAALKPLGYGVAREFGDLGCGFGTDRPYFWIAVREPTHKVHVAIASPERATVDAFHEAALAAGGTDDGAPGIREHYHPDYYGAFVLDPDGNSIEAVCHRTEG